MAYEKRQYTPDEVEKVLSAFRAGTGINTIDAECPGITAINVIDRYATDADRAERARNVPVCKNRSGRPKRVYDEETMSTLRTMYEAGYGTRAIKEALPGVAVKRLISRTFTPAEREAHERASAARLGRAVAGTRKARPKPVAPADDSRATDMLIEALSSDPDLTLKRASLALGLTYERALRLTARAMRTRVRDLGINVARSRREHRAGATAAEVMRSVPWARAPIVAKVMGIHKVFVYQSVRADQLLAA